jgi:hypothetical protein
MIIINGGVGMEKVKVSIQRFDNIQLSDTVIITDPCYDRNTWCQINDLKIKSGTYMTYSVYDYKYSIISMIGCFHTEKFEDIYDALNHDWIEMKEEIGVDSGQAGIFDDLAYPILKEIGKYEDNLLNTKSEEYDTFYEECCQITSHPFDSGVLNNRMGVVSSSGFGDGGYSAFKVVMNDEIVGLLIYFDGLDWFKEDENNTGNFIKINTSNWIDVQRNIESDPFIDWMNNDIEFRNNCLKMSKDFYGASQENFAKTFKIKTLEEYKEEWIRKEKVLEIECARNKTRDIRKRSVIIKQLLEKVGEPK